MGELPASLRIVQALLFFPRGGSAQVIRYLATALETQHVQTQIVAGSLGEPGSGTHAETFFNELDVAPVDYTPAVKAAEQGKDPQREPVPLHPSYEDRNDNADRVFASVDPKTADYLESRWEDLLRSCVSTPPDLFHIHHLSPLQSAARASFPEVPLIGHIHGTELNMLDDIRNRKRIASEVGLDLGRDADEIADKVERHLNRFDEGMQQIARTTRWPCWRYGTFWEQRLQQYTAMCDRLIVLTESAREQAATLLDYDPEHIYPVPNGVNISIFTPDRLSASERRARWKHWLVDEAQGWDESGIPGSVRYSQSDIDEWFQDTSGDRTPVLFFVGRFMAMKRVPLLIRAYRRAQSKFKWHAPLIIWGGNPGEWENEHPVTVAREEDVSGVFFVGWRGHEELPEGLNSADIMVAPSTNEPFGQVYLEAMACELPVIATQSGGPPSFINQKPEEPDGWLVPPDDEEALAAALIEAVNNPEERRKRGRSAMESVRAAYSWTQIAGRVREIYDEVLASHRNTI
jgi:D-inositol-3-phosphate glycosyltransferase